MTTTVIFAAYRKPGYHGVMVQELIKDGENSSLKDTFIPNGSTYEIGCIPFIEVEVSATARINNPFHASRDTDRPTVTPFDIRLHTSTSDQFVGRIKVSGIRIVA